MNETDVISLVRSYLKVMETLDIEVTQEMIEDLKNVFRRQVAAEFTGAGL